MKKNKKKKRKEKNHIDFSEKRYVLTLNTYITFNHAGQCSYKTSEVSFFTSSQS